ncbi:MAG: hypothetical protein FJ026_06545 [Chloroflexi bacterium]|nr:hypothetical protein [Chloroflexota bacterium]
MVRAPSLRLKMPPVFPIVFLREHDGLGRNISDLQQFMDVLNIPSYLAFLVVLDGQGARRTPPPPMRRANPLAVRLGPQREALTAAQRLIRDDVPDVVLLRFDDVFRIFLAKEPEKRLVQALLEQVDLTIVSPYVTSGPVSESMFFGRDHELGTITHTIRDRNFAVVGGRRIGKTSILTQLHHVFSASESYHTLYLDCQAVKDYDQLCDAARTIWQLSCAEPSPEHFVRAVAQLKQEHTEQVVIMLLDEVDVLLGHDIENKERLFKGLRTLSQEGRCRFVFCGGRTLVTRLHDSRSALFNFCQTVRLGYLSPRDAGRMILEPMQEMGIGFEDISTVIQRVIDLSACHPNLVQYICQQLLLQVNTRGDRLVRLSDLDEIEASHAFSECFLEVMWSSAGPLERLITLLALDQAHINPAGIKAALHAHGLDVSLTAVEKALNGLVFCSILNKEGGGYCFAARAFPSILTVTQDVNALLEQAVQAVRSEMASK